MSKKAARHGGMGESLADWPGGNLAEDGINEVSCIIVCFTFEQWKHEHEEALRWAQFLIPRSWLSQNTGNSAYASSGSVKSLVSCCLLYQQALRMAICHSFDCALSLRASGGT